MELQNYELSAVVNMLMAVRLVCNKSSTRHSQSGHSSAWPRGADQRSHPHRSCRMALVGEGAVMHIKVTKAASHE
jgi:hypothetical protein